MRNIMYLLRTLTRQGKGLSYKSEEIKYSNIIKQCKYD